MREIKFRAWVEEHNLMVYPDKDSESNVFVYNPNGFFTVAIEDIDDQANPIYIDCDVSKTTMQYTGLKDKNGIEIYESDRCMVERPCIGAIGTIKFNQGSFIFVENHTENILRLCDLKLNNYTIEVIGNIYEN